MTTEFPSINKSENEKIENCMNSLLLNSTELELEKSKGKSKESAYKVDETDAHAHADADEHADGDGDDDGERIDGPINRIAIYQTLVVNNKEIAIYQYKAFPKIYLNSVYELLSSELSEPYNIFLLKTILKNYDEIALMSLYDERCVGTVISKIMTKCKNDETTTFGYICMIAVHKSARSCGLGSYLLNESIKLMQTLYGIDEVQLEAEATNNPTLRFYEKNGFIRVKRKPSYYLSGVDAFKLKKKL